MAPRIDPVYPRNRPGNPLGRINLQMVAGIALAIMASQAAGDMLARSDVAGASSAGSTPGLQAFEGSTTAASLARPSFVQQASAIADQALPLLAAPAGGAEIARISAGTQLAIGGRVRLPVGLWSQHVYWVRLDTAAGVRYGFVAADALRIVAGAPLDLDVTGLPSERFLNPSPGDQYAGGEASIEPSEPSIVGQADMSMLAASIPRLSIAWLPATIEPWLPELALASQRHGVAVELLAIVMLVESGGNPKARSGSGAIGLMQVMPGTAADIAKWRGIQGFQPDQLLDPATNIDFGAWYLAQQLKAFGRAGDTDWQQSVELAASAYNGGPGTVQAMLERGAALPQETRRYREWVGGMWEERSAPSSTTFEAWWWAGGSRLVEAAEAQLAQR